MNPGKIKEFLQEHLGVIVNSDESLQQLLESPDLARLLRESMTSAQKDTLKFSSMDRGYSHRDDYWRLQKIPEKRIPGKAYDSQGRIMPHVELFREAAEAMMRDNPNIVARATRHGIEIDYVKRPDDKYLYQKEVDFS